MTFYNIFIKNSTKTFVLDLLNNELLKKYSNFSSSERYGDNRGGQYFELKNSLFLIEIMDNVGDIADDDYIDYEIMLLITIINNEGLDEFQNFIKTIENIIQGTLEYLIIKY